MKEIKEILLQNPIHIENILISLGFYKVHKHNKGISCCNSEKGSGNSIHIKLDDNIFCSDYKYGEKGDIFSFLMKKRQLELVDVLNIIKKELGIESFNFTKKDNSKVFGGVYSKIRKKTEFNEDSVLEESTLIPYLNKFNTRFLMDGINLDTQKKFQIGLDHLSQRITIPWRNIYGELIGIMGRYTGNEPEIPRWLPIIPFPKLNALYGYSNNYKSLVDCDELYIFESEKGVLQMDSAGINSCVSLGRNEISACQIKRLISLNPKKIVYCLDEGLPEEISIKNVKLTQQFLKYRKIKVVYIYDENNEILPQGSKAAPSDLGKDIFLKLISEKTKEVV